MMIPRNGLFFAGGEFLDGKQNRIPWSRILQVWNSRQSALAFQEKLREKWKDWPIDFVVIGVEIEAKNDIEDSG